MKILISGATGFVGKHLVKRLLDDNHSLAVIGRSAEKIKAVFGETVHSVTWSELDSLAPAEFDVVINLAGENISNKRWTDAVKSRIVASRVEATRQLADWCLKSTARKPHLYNTSAIGIYGCQASAVQTEATLTPSSQASDFLSQVGQAWEQAAQAASASGLKVTVMRFAVVLDKNEGMLSKLIPSFKFGLGSIIGNGSQIISWITIDDLIAAIVFLLKHSELTGPVNLSAPNAITQQEFAKQLAAALRRPLWLRLPVPLIKLIFGQMGVELLLGTQNVYPQSLLDAGFQFTYPDLSRALIHELKK
jgi:uncharacterized protein (TIGR01777 family)